MNKMPSNITKAFKNKSALRKMTDGGRLRQEHAQGIDRMLMGGAPAQDIIAASQDPIPQSAPVPMGATNQNPMGPAAPSPTDRVGPLGIERQYMDRANERIAALRTPEGLAAFNERQGALNSGIMAMPGQVGSLGAAGEPVLMGRPEFKTDPTAPAQTPGLSTMPAGAMIAQGQAAQNNVMLDGMRMGLRTGDRDSFGYYNQRLQDNLSSPSALGGVLPGSSPGQTTTSPVAAAPPSAAPAPAAISLQEMANAYNEAPDASLGLPPPDESPISPVPQSAASIIPTSQNSMGTLPPTANAPRNFGELGKRLSQGLRGTGSRLSNYLFNPETRTSRPPLEAPFAEYRRNLRDGGKVRGPGGPTEDKVGPVMLSNEEYVLPADTAQTIGYENLDAIKDATHVPAKKGKKGLRNIPHMYGGGRPPVGPMSFYDSPFKQHARNEAQVLQQLAAQQAAPQPGQVHGPARPVDPRVERLMTGQNSAAQPAAPAASPTDVGKRRAGLASRGIGIASVPLEVLGGFNDYREAADHGLDPSVGRTAFDSATRIGGAATGAKLGGAFGAMTGPAAPVLGPSLAVAGGAAGYFAPDMVGRMVGSPTTRSQLRGARNEAAAQMQEEARAENTQAENAPGAGQGFAPSQMMYSDGTPYLADPGRASLRSENNSIPSNAYDINRQFDSLAEELRGIHGSSVTTPFGRRRLDRSRELLDLEKARAQALSGDQTAMINQRGHDISSRDAAAGRAARAASGSAEMNASMLREMRQAENDQRERMDKAKESLWTHAERLTSDNDDFSAQELFSFMLNSEGFMDDYAEASPKEQRQMMAKMKHEVATERAQRRIADRLGLGHEVGLRQAKGIQQGARWGDVWNKRARLRDWTGDITRAANPFTGQKQYAAYDDMLVPLDEIARQNPDQRGLHQADILRRIKEGQ